MGLSMGALGSAHLVISQPPPCPLISLCASALLTLSPARLYWCNNPDPVLGREETAGASPIQGSSAPVPQLR